MFWIFKKKNKKKVEKPIKPQTPIQPEPALSPEATPVIPPLEKKAETAPKKTASEENPSYHVSHNKENKKWRVRREHSSKVIKYFDTQKEAIDYAEDLAKNHGASVVIHKLDGKIRKQNY